MATEKEKAENEAKRLDDVEKLLFEDTKHSEKKLEYLKKLKDEISIPSNGQEAIQLSMGNCIGRIKEAIENSENVEIELRLISNPRMINHDPKGLKNVFEIEEEIRKNKLREMKRMKEELEVKLQNLNEAEKILMEPMNKAEREEAIQINKERMILKQELKQKKIEANEFIRRLKLDKMQRERREQERKKEISDKLLKETEENFRKAKEFTEDLKRKKQEEKQRFLEASKQKREEELKLLEEMRTKLGLMAKDEPLYKKMEERYNKEVVIPSLEMKKKELAMKRNRLKPLSKEEIEEHARKQEELAVQREEERKNIQRAKHKEEQEMLSQINKYRTPTLDKVNQFEEALREELESKELEKKLRKEKMNNYARIVKEVCPANPSEDKYLELQKKIEQLRHPVRQPRDTRKEYDLAKLNNRSTNAGRQSSSSSERRPPHQLNKVKSALKLTTENPELPPQKKIDYLQELRKKREDAHIEIEDSRYNWEADLKNEDLEPKEKYDRLIEKANQIENKAHMQEMLLKAKGGKAADASSEVSDLYLNAIKAKIAMLEGLSQSI